MLQPLSIPCASDKEFLAANCGIWAARDVSYCCKGGPAFCFSVLCIHESFAQFGHEDDHPRPTFL